MKYENEYRQRKYEALIALTKEINSKLQTYRFEFIDTPDTERHEYIELVSETPIRITYLEYKKRYDLYLSYTTHDLPYIDSYTAQLAREKYAKPNDIGVITESKIKAWVDYLTNIYNDLRQMSKEREARVKAFVAEAIEAGVPVRQRIEKYNSDAQYQYNGELVKNGIEYSFTIDNSGHISQETKVHYKVPKTLQAFLQLSDNAYTGEK